MVPKEDSIFYNVPNVADSPRFDSSRVERFTDPSVGPIVSQYEAEQNRREDSTAAFASVVYWISLMAALIGNFVSSVILIPFILMIDSRLTLYVIIMIMGFVFGALFNFLLTDIQKLDYSHHVISGAVIPTFAVINIYIVVEVSKTLGGFFLTTVHESPMIISILYVGMYILPYLGTMIIKHYKVVRVQ